MMPSRVLALLPLCGLLAACANEVQPATVQPPADRWIELRQPPGPVGGYWYGPEVDRRYGDPAASAYQTGERYYVPGYPTCGGSLCEPDPVEVVGTIGGEVEELFLPDYRNINVQR